MKKALAGPAKPAAKKKPERRAMIAAARRAATRRGASAAVVGAQIGRRRGRRAARSAGGGRCACRGPRAMGRAAAGRCALAWRHGPAPPPRARARGDPGQRGDRRGGRSAASIVASAACLVVSQFVDYRGVEIGQPGYAGLPAVAAPPTVDVKTAGQAHSYLLVPLALLAAVARRRWRCGAGGGGSAASSSSSACSASRSSSWSTCRTGSTRAPQTSRFAGAAAVLEDGFYAELAAAAGLVLGGLLYYARPCRIPIN